MRLLERLQSQEYVESESRDPFQDYLNEEYRQIVGFLENDLYQQMVEFLDTTVFSFVEQTTSDSGSAPLTFGTFAEAFDHYEGRVTLYGQAGSGKTITMMAFSRRKFLKSPT